MVLAWVCWKQPEIRDGQEMTLSLTEGIPCCLPTSVHPDFGFLQCCGSESSCFPHFLSPLSPLGLCGDLCWSFKPEVLPFLKPIPWEWHEYSPRALSLFLYIPQWWGKSQGCFWVALVAESRSPSIWSWDALLADFSVGVT